MPHGALPTETVAVMALVAVSTTETVPAPELAMYAREQSRLRATVIGLSAGMVVATAVEEVSKFLIHQMKIKVAVEEEVRVAVELLQQLLQP